MLFEKEIILLQRQISSQHELAQLYWDYSQKCVSVVCPFIHSSSSSTQTIQIVDSSSDAIGCHYQFTSLNQPLKIDELDKEVKPSPIDQQAILQSFLSQSKYPILYRFEAIKLKTLLKTYSGCLQLSSSSLYFISTIESSFSIPLHSLYATFNRTYYGYNRGLELFFYNGIQFFFVFHDLEERNAVSFILQSHSV